MIEIVCVTVNHSYQTLNVLNTLGFQHFFIWQGYKDSNLGHAVLETADKILYNPHEYYIFGQDDSCVLQFVLQFLKMLFNYIFLLFAIWFVWNCHS